MHQGQKPRATEVTQPKLDLSSSNFGSVPFAPGALAQDEAKLQVIFAESGARPQPGEANYLAGFLLHQSRQPDIDTGEIELFTDELRRVFPGKRPSKENETDHVSVGEDLFMKRVDIALGRCAQDEARRRKYIPLGR